MASGIIAIVGAISTLPALAATGTAAPPRSAADPAIGPHTRADLEHGHDALRFTPSTAPVQPRRTRVVPASASAGSKSASGNGSGLLREVLGFAPYYELSQNANWNYSLLSTVAYFGLDVKGDGQFDMTSAGGQGWNSADLTTIINNAHQAGDRVVVVLKAAHQNGCDTACTVSQLVTSESARQAAITNTINAITQKSLDGVNVDLEGTSTGYPTVQSGFTTFVHELSDAVHAKWPSAYVTVDTYSGSASWDGGIFKIGDLAPYVDAFFVMAYDMYSADIPGHAAPNAPLSAGPQNWPYNDTTSVNQYLTKAPASKIILGVPYYGYKYCTVDPTHYSALSGGVCPDPGQPDPAKKTSSVQAEMYSGVANDFNCALQLTRYWDGDAAEPWASWASPASGDPCGGNHGSWREMFYDNAQSLGLKYDLVNSAGLRGTGMWALGYDGASQDLWAELAAKFSGGPTKFYFAEGFTGGGFSETLSLFTPTFTGTAYIDYYTETGHLPTFGIDVTAGHVTNVNVNQYVGAGHNVSAVVTLPAAGVAERVMHFNNGIWHGSTANVGVSKPMSEWDFAEGSTISAFSEYLTLENPSSTPAPVTINYFTDSGAHPAKTLTLAANSRTTVPVFIGDLSSPGAACTLSGAGANCGIGPGVVGVSAQVLSPTVPIVAERPMYVNGFNFGDGVIRDGHDAFGVNAPSMSWNFAEGNTLQGFREYLSLQNPGAADATVTLTYADPVGTVTSRKVPVKAQSRATVAVFDSTYGVGMGVSGVSVQVTSTQPIVAERPMYMVFNFGSGAVAGAHDVPGSTTVASLFEFSNASTAAGENDYLTIENPNPTSTIVVISYYGPAGRGVRSATVAGNSRHTIAVSVAGEGAGPNVSPLGIVVQSDQAVLVEEATYNAYPGTYGATDTIGYTPVP